MRFTITRKLILAIVFFVSITTIIIVFLIIPSLHSINETTIAMVTQVQNDNAEFERVRLLRKSLSEIKNIDEKLTHTDQVAIRRSEDDTLIELIELIAQNNHVDQKLSVSFKEYGQTGPFSGYYLFSFSSKGTFNNILNYLAELESTPYYFIIRKITFEKTPNSEGNFITVNFSGTLNSLIGS